MRHILPFFYDYVFPNTILPNALPPEMGVVNYIHTMYSNRLKTESFFDEDLEKEKNPMNQMFGNSFGHWPNSVRMNGSHLRSRCFVHCVSIYENSIYFGKQTTNRYIYPIKVTLHFDRFTGVDHVGSKLNGEYFWKHISAEALEDIRGGRAIIFLDWANENYIEKSQYKDFHQGLKNSGIPASQIVLAVNSFNAKQVYESWFPPEERMLEVHNLPFLLSNISWHYSFNSDRRMSEEDFRSSRNTLRKNHFLFPSRRSRSHRIAMLHKIASDGLLDKGDWSFLDNMGADHAMYESTQIFEINREAVTKLHEQIPHKLQNEPESHFLNVSGWGDKHSEPNKNSYFYIASETYVHGEYKSLTEKVFKPIINFQPFVFIAFHGALEELRKLGFKTFSPFIDESYDTEPDYAKRMQMIFAEIKKVCEMSKEDIHNWYWSMEETLIHNHRHLLELHKNEPNVLEFIKYLHDRVSVHK